MSFEIDGETWQPKTATQHADLIIDRINTLLQQEGVTDKDGNIAQLKKNYGNALYLLALGDGERFAKNDAELSKAIDSFNIELCDDQQIQNLLPIAAMTRNPGSHSTLQLAVTASADGQCVIPAGTKAPYEDMNFVVQTEVVLSAGSTALIDTVADVLGPVVVLSGEVDHFENEIANLESVTNPTSSVPGVSPESTDELRQRLLVGNTIKYSIDGCKGALEELTGINHAKVYFNLSLTETLELPGGMQLAPRTAYIVVQGSSDKIAEVYAEFMSAPTTNDPNADGSESVVDMTIIAGADGAASLGVNTTVTYEGHTFKINAATTVAQGTTQIVPFTCTEVGAFNVPAHAINALDQTVANVSSAYNATAAVPGQGDPKHSQDWVTSSGQAIPIKYDDAHIQNIYVKVYLEANAETGDQVTNQIKRDLIYSSAKWNIGEIISQIDLCEPFIDCTYTKVAYAKVSSDGVTWSDYLEVGCNEMPRITDGTINVVNYGE